MFSSCADITNNSKKVQDILDIGITPENFNNLVISCHPKMIDAILGISEPVTTSIQNSLSEDREDDAAVIEESIVRISELVSSLVRQELYFDPFSVNFV